MTEYNIVIDQSRLVEYLRGANGPAWQAAYRLGEQVRGVARSSYVPVDNGKLRASIALEMRNEGGPVAYIGSNVEYAAAVHEGTRPHTIRPKNGKALAFKWAKAPSGMRAGKDGRYVFRFVNHPGTKANPFLKKALDDVMARARGK